MHFPLYVGLQGVVLGLTYGLLAMGLVLIYKSSRVLNFAHGELGLVSAVTLHKLVADYHVPYWPTLLLVLAMAMLIGGGCELVLRRLFRKSRLLVMVATIGLAQFLFVLSVLGFLQPKHAANTFPLPFRWHLHVGPAVFGPSDFTTIVIAPIAAIALALFFSVTPYGLATRAAAENAESARLGGIWVRRTSTLAWMLAGLLSGITAILAGPTTPPLGIIVGGTGPALLVRALAAALFGAMTDLRLAFVAGIGVGVIEHYAAYNRPSAVDPIIFGLVLVGLVARVRTLRESVRTEERSSWQAVASTRLLRHAPQRRQLGQAATVSVAGVMVALPLLLSNAQAFLFSRMFVFAILGLSLTLLSGWAGQLSLGHFGLAAIGALVAAHMGAHVSFPLVLLAGGVVTAAVAVVVGLPALRMRGLYLAVTTMAFAVFVNGWVVTNRRIGLPDPLSTLVRRPSFAGLDLAPQRTFYYVCLLVVVLATAACSRLRHSGVGRGLIAVRDNETAAGAMGLPVVMTKVTAFALSGFLAGVAGVLFAFGQGRLDTQVFDPFTSLILVAMVVIGGIGSVRGALLGAAYLIGLPAVFGLTSSSAVQQTVVLLTSGLGLLLFILYLPRGLAGALERLGDVLTPPFTALLRAASPGRLAPDPEPPADEPPATPPVLAPTSLAGTPALEVAT